MSTEAVPQHLREAVQRLADARRRSVSALDALKVQRVANEEQFKTQFCDVLDEANAAFADAELAEGALRELALAHHAATGERKPAPGVEIVLKKRYEYDPARALDWAKATGMALTLDKKAFDKIASATPIPCVLIVEEAGTRIATDLDALLAEVAHV